MYTLHHPQAVQKSTKFLAVYPKAQQIYADIVEQTNLNYRAYQPRLAAYYASRPVNVCAGAQGLGKTIITALTLSVVYPHIDRMRPGSIQIIVPNLLIKNRWLTDFSRFGLNSSIEVIKSERQALKSTAPVWIYTMDFPKRKSKQRSIAHALVRHKRHPVFLCIDEIHHFKGHSDRFRAVKILRRRASRLLLLSGTLSDGQVEQIYDLLRFAYPKNFAVQKAQFLRDFQTKKSVSTNYLSGEEEIIDQPGRYLPSLSIYKIPEYAEIVRSKIHRVRLDDDSIKSCITLPVPEIEEMALPLDPDHKREYDLLVREHRADLQRCRDFATSAIGRAKALKVLEPLFRCINYPDNHTPTKLLACGDAVERFQAEGLKTVVFTNKVGSGRRVHAYLSERFGVNNTCRMYAEDPGVSPSRMTPERRDEVLSQFLWEPHITSATFSIRLAGEGIDLLQASAVIFYDLPWEAILVAQAISRCVRPGAVNPFVKILYPFQEKTVDQHVYELNKLKQQQMKLLLDYATDFGVASQSVSVVDVIDRLLASA